MAKKLQIKITLKRSKPPIWRRVILKDDISFQRLHEIIQNSMGWYNCHLYEFDFKQFSIGIPDEYALEDIVDSRKTKISNYLGAVGDRVHYNYDFGDYWQHLIRVEKVAPLVKGEEYPFCIKGKGNCPPEDCGGIWGYDDLLSKIQDKKHPEREELIEWLGGEYDPSEFDIEKVNMLLSAK